MADETSYADVVRAYSEQNLRASLAQAVNQGPDQEAGVQALASQYNLPVESVRLQQPEIERRAKLDSVDYGTLVSEYKKTTKFLSDRNNAAVGHDDIDTLTAYEALYGSISPIRGPEPSLWSTIRGVGSSVVTGLELTRQGIRQQYADLFGLPEMSRNAQQKAEGARLTQEQYDPEFQTSLGGGVYSGLTSTAQMAGPVVASIATGNPLPAIAAAGVQTQTEAYTRYRARGASPGQAFLGSALEGGTEVATEAVPMGFLVNRFGKVGAGEFLSGLLGRELPSEQIATIVQDAIDTAIANPDKTWGEYFAERPDAAYQTALATITGSAVMGGASAGAYVLSGERNRAMKAQKDAEALTKIDAVVAASKLRERSPQKFEEFVAQATEDGPVQNIYIDPKALAQSGVNPEELAKVSRSVAEQVNTAITTGVDIRIPIAEYSTYIAGTDAGKALLDYIKTDPEGMSRKEAEEFYQKEGDALKAEVEKVLTAKQNDEAWQQSLAQVKEDFMGKLKAANRFTSDVNEAYLAPYLAGVQARAAKMGITPMDFYKQYGLGVQAESVAGPALDQKQSPEDFSNTLSEKYGADVALVGKDTLTLSAIKVPEGERGQGAGTKMMQEIINYADAQGKRIVLSPSTDFGATSKARLTKFYKRFGFVENKGKNKDFSTREAMIREPQKSLAQSPYTEPTITVDGVARPTTNSNDQPIAQTKEALENFWKWFGGSKVVDADGKPLVVYHGTHGELRGGKFEVTNKAGVEAEKTDQALFFSSDPDMAEGYASANGGNIIPAYLKVEKLFRPIDLVRDDARSTDWWRDQATDFGKEVYDAIAEGEIWADGQEYADDYFSALYSGNYDAIESKPFRTWLASKGFDGFMTLEGRVDNYGVVDPTQIKSVFNTGSFSPNDPNVLYQSNDPNAAADFLRSVLLDAARNLKQAKGSGEQMLGILKNTAGVKEEEIAWTGLDEFLKGKESVTKHEIVKYLADNQVQIEEVTLGGNENEELPAGYSVERSGVSSWMVVDGEGQSVGPPLGTRDAAIRGYLDQEGLQTSATKFSQYTLPGGENYREVLLTLPNQDPLTASERAELNVLTEQKQRSGYRDDVVPLSAAQAERLKELQDKAIGGRKEAYKSSHYDQPNILAHFRLNDRTDADGKKVLFIEEIQSDWHQAGRKKGYRSVANAPKVAERGSDYFILQDENGNRIEPPGGFVAWTNREAAEQAAKDFAVKFGKAGAVPDAPFKKTWHEMAFRRITQMAAQQGYDRIAWTTGEQQAERYDLSKSIDQIVYGPDFSLVALDKDGRTVIGKTVPEDQLEEVIGKETAKKLVEAKPNADGERVLNNADLKVGGEGMKGFYDNILVKYAQKFGKNFGAKVGETDISEDARPIKDQQVLDLAWELGSPETSTAGMSARVHSLDITPEMVDAANKGFELFQGKRGAYSPKQRMTTLLNAADLTTFLHELGHYFLDIDTQIAMRADAPAEIKADVDTVLKWFGLEGDTPEARLQRWMAMPLDEQRPYHEQFAESFEHYLFEGKAPSIELQNVFKRFRAWMLATYKSLQDFLARNPSAGKLNDEIRGVMDRMLATTEQIKEAEITRSMQPLFVSLEDAKMTPEEFKAYHDLGVEATQDAVDNLERRSMRDMQWASNAKGKVLKQLQKDVAAKRASVRREVTEEVMNEPINRAREFLKRGTLEIDENANQDMRRLATELGMEGSTKLNLGALKEMYGEESNAIWRALPTGQYGFVSNDGIHPDAVAEMFGFSSGDELVRELLAAENPRDKIVGLTDQRMLERYGDITDPSELKKAADAAIHNDVRTRFVATELNALQKATGGRKILAKAAKEYAEAMVARLKVRDLSPARFASAEARAAKAAETALKAGKLPEAAIEKRNQLINTYATQAAYKAQDEVEKGLRYLKKFDKESVAKSIDPDYVDQIHALMERFDLRKATTLKDIAKRKALTEWVAKQQELGLEPEIPAEILNEANRKSYKEMPVEEMRGLLDTVKQIEHLGRLKNKLLTAQDQRAFDAIVQEMVVGINEAAGSKPRVDNTTPNTNAGQVVLGFKSYLAAHRKMASLAREMDGWKDGGPVWNTLIRSMNTAGDTEATMRAKASRELAKLVQPVLKEGKMGGKGIFFPTLNRSLNREARIAIALNMGNAGNIQRLLDGEGWTAEQLKPVLDTITPAEAEFVQNVWDFFESFRPQIAAKERRVYGKEPAWVEPQPVMLGGKELRGGYYPIKFDPRRSQAAEQHNDAEKAQQMMRGAYTSATTRRSFTKTRVDEVKGRPLLYSMDGIFQGVNEVIHDLSWHEWLIDANRLFRNKSFDGAIRNRFGADVVKQFKGGIEAVASGETRDTHVLDKPVNYLRIGTSISGLGFNLVNSLVNLSGITQSAVRVGAPWIAQGAGALARNPVALITQIHELSPFMRERSRTFNREVNEVLSVVRGQSKARQHMARFFYAPMMATQLAVDMPTWWGAYQKALSQGNEDAKAVAMADQAVIDSQSAGQIKDLAAIQRGSPIWKLFTTFYGYFSSTYNLTTEAVKKTDFNDPLDVLRLGGDFVLLYAVPVLFSVAIKAALMGGDDDEDKLYEKMAAEGIGYMMGTMVGLREFSGAVQTAAGVNQYGGDYGGPAGLRLFNAVAKLAKQAEQGEMDRPLLRQAINVGGIVLHLPSGQINRTIDGMTALSEGRTQNPLAIVGGAPTK